jgi:hypothetical protein
MADKQQLLQGCKALVYKWASVHFKSYLDKLDEQLFRMADKAGSNQEQNRFLLARKQMLEQRRVIEKYLLDHMRVAFDNFLQHNHTSADIAYADEELQLVDNDQLEQSIAVAGMTRKANADYSEALYALNQRLSVLAGGTKISDLGNPVAPAVFTEAIQQALQALAFETAPKLVIYKMFDATVMSKLDKLYHLLNHHLKTAGILAHLRYRINKSEEALPSEFADQSTPETFARQSDLMTLVQHLQSAMVAARPPIANALPAAQIALDLQPLQKRSAETLAAVKTQQAIFDTDYVQLPQQIERETQRAIDADVIEIVGLLFDYMLNDEQLPDSVKALLSYLHTPFLKVALLDKAFFNSPQHPARQLLNALVAAGERWVEAEGRHRNEVFQQIKAVVQQILDDFDSDLRLFSQLAFDFNHFLRQHARRVRLAEQRALQAARGEDTLKEIRMRVEQYLEQKCTGLELPHEVRALLKEPWANVLAFNLLRFGSASPQWQTAAQVVDDILIYLHPQQLDQTDIWKLRDRLNEALNHGFQTVGYEAESGQQLLDALHRAHQQQTLSAALSAQRQAPPTVDIDAPAVATAAKVSSDPLLVKLSALEFGTWFLFAADRPPKEQVRAKLAWSNTRTQHYMFVNRLGQQTAVKSGAELAREIRIGCTKILQPESPRPFFEKALERIAEQLRLNR